jgi:toxin ParE1/3/4
MTPVRWSPEAAADLEGIVDHVSIDNYGLAPEVAERIFEQVEMLRRFPQLGRPGNAAGARELVIAGLPFIVVYELHAGAVEILRIVHGAQDWT